MSRSERLLNLLQILRRYRNPVAGKTLAGELGVTVRTIYRDIAVLQAQGADIVGEPGIGYLLKPGFLLPPLMLTQNEVEAILLGSNWVAQHADGSLALAARDALTKIVAVIPADQQKDIGSCNLLIPPGKKQPISIDLEMVRMTIRLEQRLSLIYRDANGMRSERVVWPFALAFLNDVQILVTWCELRNDFRHFRIDRIESAIAREGRYPRRRQAMLKVWQDREISCAIHLATDSI